jgi:hypothetical protein
VLRIESSLDTLSSIVSKLLAHHEDAASGLLGRVCGEKRVQIACSLTCAKAGFVLLEFFSAFGAEGGIGWAFFSAAFAGDWLSASGLFEVFFYGFEGFLYFFGGCLERLFHFDPHL